MTANKARPYNYMPLDRQPNALDFLYHSENDQIYFRMQSYELTTQCLQIILSVNKSIIPTYVTINWVICIDFLTAVFKIMEFDFIIEK